MYILINKPVDVHMDSIHELLTEKNNVGKSLNETPPPLAAQNTLDTESEGLVVLSDKTGEKSMSKAEQEYEITIDNYLSKDAEKILKKGMVIDENFIGGIRIQEEKHKGNRSVVVATMTEHTAQNIRNFFELIGYRVSAVRCIRIGEFKLGVLSIGKWKKI